MALTLKHDGLLRTALIPGPGAWQGYPTGAWRTDANVRDYSLPVVLALHGEARYDPSTRALTGGNAADFMATSKLHDGYLVDPVRTELRCLTVYPEAAAARFSSVTEQGGAVPFGVWNNGYWGRDHDLLSTVDDVGYIAALLTWVFDRFTAIYGDFLVKAARGPRACAFANSVAEDLLDATRVYLVGHGSGAAMVYRLACELPARLDALAPSWWTDRGGRIAGLAVVGGSRGGFRQIRDVNRLTPDADWDPTGVSGLPSNLDFLAIHGGSDELVVPGSRVQIANLASVRGSKEYEDTHVDVLSARAHFSLTKSLEPWAYHLGLVGSTTDHVDIMDSRNNTFVRSVVERWRYAPGAYPRGNMVAFIEPRLDDQWPTGTNWSTDAAGTPFGVTPTILDFFAYPARYV